MQSHCPMLSPPPDLAQCSAPAPCTSLRSFTCPIPCRTRMLSAMPHVQRNAPCSAQCPMLSPNRVAVVPCKAPFLNPAPCRSSALYPALATCPAPAICPAPDTCQAPCPVPGLTPRTAPCSARYPMPMPHVEPHDPSHENAMQSTLFHTQPQSHNQHICQASHFPSRPAHSIMSSLFPSPTCS